MVRFSVISLEIQYESFISPIPQIEILYANNSKSVGKCSLKEKSTITDVKKEVAKLVSYHCSTLNQITIIPFPPLNPNNTLNPPERHR